MDALSKSPIVKPHAVRKAEREQPPPSPTFGTHSISHFPSFQIARAVRPFCLGGFLTSSREILGETRWKPSNGPAAKATISHWCDGNWGLFLKNGEEGEVERCLIDLLADAAGKKNKREKLRQIASRELEL